MSSKRASTSFSRRPKGESGFMIYSFVSLVHFLWPHPLGLAGQSI